MRDAAVRLAEPGDAPSVALLLHDFNTEFGEPVPEPGELARRLGGLIESGAITVLLAEGEGLVVLRFQLPHAALALFYGVDRSTITRAISEVRPLLAERGCTVEGGLRLHTLADVITHLGASGQLGLGTPPVEGQTRTPDTVARNLPAQVPGLTDAVSGALGFSHSSTSSEAFSSSAYCVAFGDWGEPIAFHAAKALA